MKKLFQAIIIFGLLGLSSAAIARQGAQSAEPEGQSPTVLENGAILYAELSKTVDAKKAKAGDPVTAQLLADVLSHGKIVARHDSKLIGHVTEAQARTKENPESRLGIVFDKVILKGGKELPFRSLLLAIRPFERPVVDIPSPPSQQGSGPTAGPLEDRPYPSGKGPSPRFSSSLGGELKARDREMTGNGPTDIDGLSLSSGANGKGQAIVSITRTVKLESGVRLELRVTDAAK